ncbi:MAG: ImmA/IrrE family metallo-endopeptidase [Clostridia bacterium]|nr:ImmA/IrrE family metallo-endopeptidase [Clostridia bacterium]
MNFVEIDCVIRKLLHKHKIHRLPVKLGEFCKSENIRLFSYFEGDKLIKHLKLENHKVGEIAFSIGRVIFFDSTQSVSVKQFAVAHELGHIFLHKGRAEAANKEMEREADYFAARILGLSYPRECPELHRALLVLL